MMFVDSQNGMSDQKYQILIIFIEWFFINKFIFR